MAMYRNLLECARRKSKDWGFSDEDCEQWASGGQENVRRMCKFINNACRRKAPPKWAMQTYMCPDAEAVGGSESGSNDCSAEGAESEEASDDESDEDGEAMSEKFWEGIDDNEDKTNSQVVENTTQIVKRQSSEVDSPRYKKMIKLVDDYDMRTGSQVVQSPAGANEKNTDSDAYQVVESTAHGNEKETDSDANQVVESTAHGNEKEIENDAKLNGCEVQWIVDFEPEMNRASRVMKIGDAPQITEEIHLCDDAEDDRCIAIWPDGYKAKLDNCRAPYWIEVKKAANEAKKQEGIAEAHSRFECNGQKFTLGKSKAPKDVDDVIYQLYVKNNEPGKVKQQLAQVALSVWAELPLETQKQEAIAFLKTFAEDFANNVFTWQNKQAEKNARVQKLRCLWFSVGGIRKKFKGDAGAQEPSCTGCTGRKADSSHGGCPPNKRFKSTALVPTHPAAHKDAATHPAERATDDKDVATTHPAEIGTDDKDVAPTQLAKIERDDKKETDGGRKSAFKKTAASPGKKAVSFADDASDTPPAALVPLEVFWDSIDEVLMENS